MADITAAMVKELREKTDAPMMECKRALSEAQGDMGRAEDILRVKLGNKASKAASRVTAEGVVATYLSADAKLGALVEINCETDFVAKNDEFLAMAAGIARLVALNDPTDVAALSALPLDGGTVESVRSTLVGKVGENMAIRRFARMQSTGRVAQYVHGGRIGVMVDYDGSDDQVGKDVAMHIAASKPRALDTASVPAADVEKERSIAAQKAAESGKPEAIVARMVEGSVQKYLKEVALLGQPFVKDDKQTVEQMLKARNTTVRAFVLYVVGEGIEKKIADFAAEVAAAARA